MHAVFVEVDSSNADMEEAHSFIRQTVVRATREFGALAGYWLSDFKDGRRVSVIVFSTAAEADQLASQLTPGEHPGDAPDGITVRNVEVSEVIASF